MDDIFVMGPKLKEIIETKKDLENAEVLKNIELAQESVTGYKFSCSGLPSCTYCAKRPIGFVCLTVKEAEEHSLHNFVAMWIEKV